MGLLVVYARETVVMVLVIPALRSALLAKLRFRLSNNERLIEASLR